MMQIPEKQKDGAIPMPALLRTLARDTRVTPYPIEVLRPFRHHYRP